MTRSRKDHHTDRHSNHGGSIKRLEKKHGSGRGNWGREGFDEFEEHVARSPVRTSFAGSPTRRDSFDSKVQVVTKI